MERTGAPLPTAGSGVPGVSDRHDLNTEEHLLTEKESRCVIATEVKAEAGSRRVS